MKFWSLTREIIRCIRNVTSTNKTQKQMIFPKSKLIQELSETQIFTKQIEKQLLSPDNKQQITNMQLIKKIVTIFYNYIFLLIALSLLSILALVCQPFLNNFIKQLISHKFDTANFYLPHLEILSVFLAYKIVSAFLYVASDCLFIILGVKIHSFLVKQLIMFKHRQRIDCNLIACVEEDCQRVIYIPFCALNSSLKIIQFFILSSMLIIRLPSNQLPISIIYLTFLAVLIIMAIFSLKLNLKIMGFKQKRINFLQQPHQILTQRSQQLQQIKFLMIIDGIGVILPWIIDAVLMILIYGIIGMNYQQKYFVLIIFGLLRASISGLGSYLNLLAQGWSSLTRISNYLNGRNHSILSLSSEQLHIEIKNKKQSSQYLNRGKHAKLSNILKVATETTKCFLFQFLLLAIFIFSSNVMYAYCAKSVISGQSIFIPFNVASLLIQFLSPTLLFWFICSCNLRMSKSVYQPLLSNTHTTISLFGPQDINRLSGDVRLLDRQLYISVYGCMSRFSSIYSSFIYSAITLNYLLFSALFIVIVIIMTIWLILIFDKFITFRKQCYRKEASSKGMLLQQLVKQQNYNAKWKKIYSYKYFGYFIQIAFFSVFFTIMIILSFIAVTSFTLTNVSSDSIAIIIMLISQLDSQFLSSLVQLINLQLVSTAICRCFSVLSSKSY